MSLNSNSGCYRKESENSVITLNDDAKSEYLMSVGNDLKVEVYDLNSESVIYTTTTSSFIDSKTMDSQIQTFLKYYDGSNYYGFQRLNNYPTIQKELEKAFVSWQHLFVLRCCLN